MSVPIDEPEKKKILVIDDSDFIHRIIHRRSEFEGFTVLSALNGVDGLVVARAETPALVLLDLSMPVMDGFEVLRELKDDPDLMHIPVIVLSGSDDSRDKVQGLELGAIDYICKPFDFAELQARVRSALRISSLMEILARRAQIDGMTGLWNRAYFDDSLANEFSASGRSGQPLSLAICDIDKFKYINDTYGHPAGDEVIEGVAAMLQRGIRQHDTACRYGGEEFALIFRDAEPDQAAEVLERIRQSVRAQTWPKHPERPVTISAGVTSFRAGITSAQQLVDEADAALYEAKRSGRNRVVLFSDIATAKKAS